MNLKELSTLLGLSQTTVSRALNDYPEVSETTRKKVKSAARTHNYSPNPRARSLATGRNHAVAHVFPASTDHEVVNPVFADFIAGASEIYLREGYDMVLSIVPDSEEADAYRKIAAKGAVDGVIIHAPKQDDPRLALLREIGMPFVVHGRASDAAEADYSWVDMDNLGAFTQATDYLIGLGHERIGLLNGLANLGFAESRLRGYKNAHAAKGLPVDPALCHHAEMTETVGYEATLALLDGPNPPTAILASSIVLGFGVRRAAQDRGLTLGRDLSLIVHDDDLSYLRNGAEVPMFTATRSSVRAAGRRCAEMLIQHIKTPATGPEHEVITTDLVIGPSTGPRARQ